MGDGTFGLSREQILANSKVREVFTPFAPINLVDHFFGREREVAQLVSVINSPGQHVLLYGDRGIGKTSLATISCHLISRNVSHGKFFLKRCDSEDTLASVVRDPLRYAGIDYEISEQSETHTEGGDARVNILVAEGGVRTRRSKSITRVPEHKAESPSWVAERLRRVKALFLIDEADALSRKGDRKKIAELIKLLSDAKSDFKIMVVGIAETGEDLTAGHPSVERCLKETHLSRMSDVDLRKIILKGMERLRLSPSDAVVERIVEISSGYPHFTHLICLKCAENAILERRGHIGLNHLGEALRDAVAESEGVLKRRYESTIRGTKHAAEYASIMRAAADCPLPDFHRSQLEERLKERLPVSVPRSILGRYVANMLSTSSKGVFSRVSKGVYKFSDPRMPSYIKMVESQASSGD